MTIAGTSEKPEEVITPDYKYKYKQLPILESYEGTFPEEYWSHWDTNPYNPAVKSWVDPDKLLHEAQTSDYQDTNRLAKAVEMLRNGATLGTTGNSRLPSSVRNSRSVWEQGAGPKVADTLHDWVTKGIVFGPIKPENMPFKEFKSNPLSVKPKPRGRIRLCMDLSAPHDADPDSNLPTSVNSGIDKSTLSTRMSTTEDVCKRIYKFGCPGELTKADFTDAYKHISMKHEDRALQTYNFGGRYFIEKSLTFGSTSSADRFDTLSDIVYEIALTRSAMWKDDSAKVLDDVVAFGSKDSGMVAQFHSNYRELCEQVDIKLADEEDKDKAFPPSSSGLVLGIFYDLVDWTWKLPGEKADTLLLLLWDLKNSYELQGRKIERICGKINHYHLMAKYGKFERSWLLELTEGGASRPEMVKITKLAREQAGWWIKSINLCKQGTRIRDPRAFTPRTFLAMYPDAAGGLGPTRSGAGSCFLTSSDRPWIYLAWPTNIHKNKPNAAGIRFAHKTSTLEAAAALLGLCSEPDLVRNKRLVIFSDNDGFVKSYAKGHSRCGYLHTMSKAINYVASCLNCNLSVESIQRRSGQGACVADDLSKGNIETALETLECPARLPSRITRALSEWLSEPTESRTLGERITDELSEFTQILQYGQH